MHRKNKIKREEIRASEEIAETEIVEIGLIRRETHCSIEIEGENPKGEAKWVFRSIKM